MLIYVISDTHGLLRPALIPALADADAILHAGDVGKPGILNELRKIAPLHVVRGNVDLADWAMDLPASTQVAFQGYHIHILHNIDDLLIQPEHVGVDWVIFGHSHKPTYYHKDGVHYLNPGSIGPRRFSLPVSFARLRLTETGLQHEFCHLPV